MRNLTIELPAHEALSEFNLRRWDEILADPVYAKHEFRVESDRFGNVVMSPPPAPRHGRFQSRLSALLEKLMPAGSASSECPVSTADGVKAVDVAWASAERWSELGNRSCFAHAPEICVEVLSPRNSDLEIKEKTELYFDAGALEVWLCDSFGNMTFFGPGPSKLNSSRLCPDFPSEIVL